TAVDGEVAALQRIGSVARLAGGWSFMSENIHKNIHERACQLISQERIEGISGSENNWLAAHLQECDSCADFARKTSAALRSLQTIPVALPAGLAERTQFRVGLRAQQLRQHEP